MRLTSSHDRRIIALAVPALGALVADPILSLADTAFMGRVGTGALAALGVAGAVFAVAFFSFNFLEYGTTTAVAAAVGREDLSEAGRATVTAMAMAGVAGVAATGVLVAVAGPVVRVFVADPVVRSGAITYVSIRALAAPALLVVLAGHGAFRGYQDTRTPFWVALGINGINLVLDPILIFAAGWGIAGAAWATLTAQYAGAVAFIALLRRHPERYGLGGGTRPVMSEVRTYLRVGRDLAIRSGALLAAFTAATVVAARISDVAVAAHQVLFQLFIFLALALDALAIAAQAMVGAALGAGERDRAREIADRVLVLGCLLGLGLTAILAAIGPFLPSWFTADPAVRHALRVSYPILVGLQPLAAAVFAWDGIFIGAADYVFMAVSTILAAACAVGVLLGVHRWGWGLPGVWWGIAVLLVVRGLTLAWRRVGRRSPLRRPV